MTITRPQNPRVPRGIHQDKRKESHVETTETQVGESSRRRGLQQHPSGAAIPVALAATWVAGFVDATGWMLLSHIYTSNMTGNSISMAVQWLKGDWTRAAERAWPVVVFVCGLVLSAIITEFFVRRGIKSFSAANLGIEAVLLGAFVLLARGVYSGGDVHTSGSTFEALVALLALGMGIQNQTITHIGALTIHTTHVTGTLTKLGADAAEFMFWVHDRSHTLKRFLLALRLSWRKKEFRDMMVNFGLWTFFTVGAVAAVFANRKWGPWGLIAPIIILLSIVAVDLLRPMMASAEALKLSKTPRVRQ